MNELQILFTLFGEVSITTYGLLLLLGAVLGVALAIKRSKKYGISTDCMLTLSAITIAGAVLGGRVVYCLTMLDYIMADFGGAVFIPKLWLGGYSVYGALLGGMAAIAIYAKVTGKSALKLLDLAAPSAAVVIAVGRAAEYFTSQGLGRYLMDEAFCRFPFAIQGPWGDWQIPVFMYESLGALIIAIVLLCLTGKMNEGRLFEVFIILFALSQIIFDSWREDDFIRFGFVRFNQLAGAIALAIVGEESLRRIFKKHGKLAGWQIARIVMFVLGVGIVIAIEFALDKTTISDGVLYIVMAMTLTMMGICELKEE